jgi:hypothetical protein
LNYAASRYDYAFDHYLARPLQEWTPELEAEFRAYVNRTDWLAAGCEVVGQTGICMVATPYVSYASGYLWSAGGIGGRILVSTVGAGGLAYNGWDAYTIIRDWKEMQGAERFRRVGNLAGPTAAACCFGPHYYNLGRNAGELNIPFFVSWNRVTPPYYGIDVWNIRFTDTVIKEIPKKRPYIRLSLLMKEIIESRRPIADPGTGDKPGIRGALRWDAPGWYNDSFKVYELVIDANKNEVIHFCFRRGEVPPIGGPPYLDGGLLFGIGGCLLPHRLPTLFFWPDELFSPAVQQGQSPMGPVPLPAVYQSR